MNQESEFISVIKNNEGILYKLSKAYADTREDQQDLYQEIVYQLYRSFGSFKGKAQRSTWMYRVALNTAIAYLNQKKRERHVLDSEAVFKQLFEEKDALIDDRIAFLYRQIKELREVDRGIILLFLEGKSHKEMAQITGFSVSNIGTRISRIKEQLKAKKPKI